MSDSAAAELLQRAVGPAPVEGGGIPMPPVFESIADARRYQKEQLATAFRLFGRFGYCEGVLGHITMRDPEHPESLWVNPLGMSFSNIKASDLILADYEGNVLEGKRALNRASYLVHAQVHKNRPDATVVVHTHSIYGKSFSTLGIPLAPLTQEACAFFEDQGLFTDYAGIVDDVDEGQRVSKALGDHKAVIMQNHGLLTVGESVPEAAWWFISLDRCCQTQLMAMAAGSVKTVDRETALGVRGQIGIPAIGWFQAQPWWDQIAASDPDLFG